MRRILIIPALLALVLGGPVLAAEKEKRARLGPTKPRRAYRRAWDGSYAPWPKGMVAVRKARIEGEKVLLFDVDGNGSWADFGTDAWTVDDKRVDYAVPLEREIALDARRFEIAFTEDEEAITYVAHGKHDKSQEAEAVRSLNVLRMANGLPPVWIDADMSAKCRQHAVYMDLNGIGHQETPGKKGYSPEGDEAGRHSGVCYDNAINSVDRFWRTVFHRTGPCNPESRRAGIASSVHHTALWVERARRAWTYPVLIPAPGATGVQTALDPRELPRPSPELPNPGMPVQALWRLGSRPPTPAGGELRTKNEKGRVVEAVFSSPEHPAHASHPKNRFSLCLLPASPLRSGTTYWVRMHWVVGEKAVERTWSFTCR